MTSVDSLRDRRVLILGGLGFIGSNLAHRCVAEGAHVTLVDSMLPNFGGNLANVDDIKDAIDVNYSDLRDQYSLEYLVQDADVLFSVAGQISHIDSMRDPFTDLDINCRSQLSLLECCRHHNPEAVLIYASTRQFYGRPQYLPVDEDHPLAPVDVNGINKLAAEYYYMLYARVYGLRCVSLRLTNTYGPRQHLRGSNQGFTGVFLRQALHGERIQIFGDGTQRRDFNYIDDVVEAFCRATVTPETYGKVYNLAADSHYSLEEFVQTLQRYCKFEYGLVAFPPDRKAIDIGDYYGTYQRLHGATGWAPRVELDEGLQRTVEYFKPRLEAYR